MTDRTHELPLARQAALLRLSRSHLYYEPRPVPAAELVRSMRCTWTTRSRAAGCCAMCCVAWGVVIGRELVRTMMRRMCIEALYRRPNTSKPAPGHKIYPYLLRGLAIERPNHV